MANTLFVYSNFAQMLPSESLSFAASIIWIGRFTEVNYPGPESSKVVIYCLYSAR